MYDDLVLLYFLYTVYSVVDNAVVPICHTLTVFLNIDGTDVCLNMTC